MRVTTRRVVKASIIASIGAIALVAATFVLFPGAVLGAVLTPGVLVLPLMAPVIYRLVPEGGGPAGVGALLLGATVVWTLIGIAIQLLLLSLRAAPEK